MRRITTCIVGLAVIGACLSSTGALQAAQPADNPCPLAESGVYICPIKGQASVVGQPPRAASTIGGDVGAGSNIVYVPHKRISTDPDGDACVETMYIPAGTPARPNFGLPDTEQGPGGVSGLYETAPPCPLQPDSPSSEPGVTPLTIALSHWARIPLPRPQPRIAPGRAITGKDSYLETKGRLAHTYTSDTVFGVLEIVAKGSHYVDWGDGTSSGPYISDGAPWPRGDIVHDYLNVGIFDVVVTTKWTATWRLGGERGSLPPTETTGQIENFPVEQVQAVIGR